MKNRVLSILLGALMGVAFGLLSYFAATLIAPSPDFARGFGLGVAGVAGSMFASALHRRFKKQSQTPNQNG